MAHPCDLCCEVLATEDDLFLHLATHADLNINLELENNHFSQETPVESLLASTEKLLYICEICKAECPTISDLKTHVLGHSNDKILFENPVKSEEPSPLELSSTSLALSHISVKTNNNQLQYQCEICDKTFSSWTHTKRHLLMHTGEKPHQCNVCGKGFAQKTDMLRHFKTHTGQRDYRCEICEKTFTLKSNLKSHLLTHSSDKAHQCHLCEKWFALKSYLSAHLRWHQKRQHKCDVCGEVFNQRKGLLSHQLLQHSRAQQYQCNVCSISFTEKNNLDIHSLIHEDFENLCSWSVYLS
ncbi:hypothetical protein JTE90_006810 [Oedothorax gibbosus]|uniref:C2H2-type domain-containing protein n=1 Tax=Oedothorax gibbosus TaxID=931172 RepID=A0AAV6VPG2_9ARAC|nr:hypothetical protein JTE90_006810 [Oedothorax gibbosus]